MKLLDARIPNDDTIAALEEPAQNLRQFDSAREVIADLEARSDTGIHPFAFN